MGSAQMLNDRKTAIEHWLAADCGIQSIALQPMIADASFRRYFRLHHQGQTFVVMDAPPPLENCRPFVSIAHALRKLGIHTPEVIAAQIDQGYLLLSDFGDATYLATLTTENANVLYHLALDALAVLAQCQAELAEYIIPPFTAEWMWQEWAWFKEWFIHRYLGLALPADIERIEACYRHLVQSALAQPQYFMHRDYHSANLMVLPQGQVGILDFQDAFIGPVTYDLASLLRDSYIEWPPEQVQQWVCSYLNKLHHQTILSNVDEQTFLSWFDLMSIQRNLKALMTFARKQMRDGHPRYLKHVPRTLGYIIDVSRQYPECAALHHYLQTAVLPAWETLSHREQGRCK